MRPMTTVLILTALTLSAAMFGFFYAWVCSTMWGLDAADPRVAIPAMQAMNGSIRNAVFFPVFFLTGPVLMLAGLLIWRDNRVSAACIAAGGVVCLLLVTGLTMTILVPMNEEFATIPVPQDRATAHAIWTAYSQPWQVWNQTRTVTAGIGFLIALIGVLRLARMPIGKSAHVV